MGFYGVIDERFDIELLDKIAQERPNWSFVMVGPVVKISEDDLPRRPNIADTVDDVAKAVRRDIKYGADWIKLMGTGGVADLTARTVAQKMGENLGQSIVIENKPGAGGIAAAESVLKAEPDGYTLLLISNGTAVSAGLFKKLPFDPRRDLAPVSLLGQFDLAVLVPESSPHKNFADWLAWGRAHPGKMNLGTINIGSTQHLAAELFRSQANLVAQVVPYNGTPAVINALRGGQIDAAVEILGPMKPQIQAKAVRALAVMGDTLPVDLPAVVLVSSQPGLSQFQVSSWNALAAPARTPDGVPESVGRPRRVGLSGRPGADRAGLRRPVRGRSRAAG